MRPLTLLDGDGTTTGTGVSTGAGLGFTTGVGAGSTFGAAGFVVTFVVTATVVVGGTTETRGFIGAI